MRASLSPEMDVQSVARSAAEELLPVVVDLGPDQARFSSFIGSIEEQNGGEIVLEPVAADALPDQLARPLRISPAVPNPGWSIIATEIRRDGASRARVSLSHARVVPNTDEGEVVVQPGDLLVLVVPGGLHDGSSYVFPVQRIGADVCEIRSNVALAPGQELECVELVGDRRLLRRASAQVLETLPWYASDGSKSFWSRVSLREEIIGDPAKAHDLVTDPGDVRRLLDLAGMMRGTGWFESPGWGRGALQFTEITKDGAVFELSTVPAGPIAPHRTIRIGIEIFAIAYELDVRPIALLGSRLRTSLPLILRRRRRHRRDQRVSVQPEQHVDLSFRNPVTGLVHTHRVAEVSFFGVRFECEPTEEVLWHGLPLEQAQLTWNDRLIHLGDLVVEEQEADANLGRVICLASIPNSSIADNSDMICLLASLGHPHVRMHSGDDFSALHQVYLKAGLFGPHMHRNLAPIMDQARDSWRRLHGAAADVARTFLHGPDQAPDAAVTIVRAWEHAWVLQHFVDTSTDVAGAAGRLQAAYLDHLVPRPDGRYLLFFVKTDNSIMNAFLRRFFAGTGTPDAVTRSTVELWSRPPDAISPALLPPDSSVRECLPEEELVVARAAQRCLGASAAGALSILPGELQLPDTQARFARAGLERSRNCCIVEHDKSLAYALLEERSTPGVNLTWMLNATWILPIHAECDAGGAALDRALQYIVEQPPQAATGERFLNLPEGIDPDRLAAWGFEKEASLYLYVLTRAGLHRLFHYAAHRYGELEVRALSRERRRAALPSG